MRRVAFAAAVFVGVFCSLDARAAKFTSDKGFSLEYPDDWQVATKDQQEALRKVAKVAMRNLKELDLNKVAVLIFSPVEDDFAENVNVVITGGAPPVNEKERQEYEQTIRKEFSQAGITVLRLKTEITKVGDRKAFSARYEVEFPFAPARVRQWQLVVPAGRKTYFLTCSAQADNFAEVEPVFSKIVNSLEIEGGGLADFWFGLPKILQYAIIGGVIGGFIGLVQWLAKRPKAQPVDAPVDPFERSQP